MFTSRKQAIEYREDHHDSQIGSEKPYNDAHEAHHEGKEHEHVDRANHVCHRSRQYAPDNLQPSSDGNDAGRLGCRNPDRSAVACPISPITTAPGGSKESVVNAHWV